MHIEISQPGYPKKENDSQPGDPRGHSTSTGLSQETPNSHSTGQSQKIRKHNLT